MKYQNPTLHRHTRPTGTFVTIRARDDLDPSSDSFKVQHSGRSVTAIPENVGVCEIMDVGPDVTNVKPGDVCFIDFFDVAQGYIVSGEEIYVTQAMALRMTLDIETSPVLDFLGKDTGKRQVNKCEITPLPGYALTKHAAERMTVAITGCDRVILPRHMTTSGIVGARDSDGQPSTMVCYEELVQITQGAIQAERYAEKWDGSVHDTYFEERRLKAKIERLTSLLKDNGIVAEPAAPVPDVKPGDLVVFCSDFSIQFRAMGELFRCVPYKNLLATIDDRAILEDYNKTNPPKPLVQIIGGGEKLLYGT